MYGVIKDCNKLKEPLSNKSIAAYREKEQGLNDIWFITSANGNGVQCLIFCSSSSWFAFVEVHWSGSSVVYAIKLHPKGLQLYSSKLSNRGVKA